uniref:Triacylglycerol lipase n=1 Tax=Solanum tuberosum TaxID=4113 RepID=M1AIS1_SOLTU
MATSKNGGEWTGDSRFFIVNYQTGGILDLMRFVQSGNSDKFLHYSDGVTGVPRGGGHPDHRWVIFVSIIVRKIIAIFGKPMEWFGYLLEFILNLLSLNGNFFGLFYNILHGK